MNESKILSIATAEEKAMDILELELLEPLTVASRGCDLIGRVLEKATSSNLRPAQSKKVSMALLSRIANDLRCCIFWRCVATGRKRAQSLLRSTRSVLH